MKINKTIKLLTNSTLIMLGSVTPLLAQTESAGTISPGFVYQASVVAPELNSEITTNKIDVKLKLDSFYDSIPNVENYDVKLVLTLSSHETTDLKQMWVTENEINSNYYRQSVAQITLTNEQKNADSFEVEFKNVPLMFLGKSSAVKDNYISCNVEYSGIQHPCYKEKEPTTLLSHKVTYKGDTYEVPVFRYWSPVYESHFYISKNEEKAYVDNNTEWNFEGLAYYGGLNLVNEEGCFIEGQKVVHRFWSPDYDTHFFTINEAEAKAVKEKYPSNIWTYEGPAFCAYPKQAEGTKAVYRFWSDTYMNHFFTSNAAEKDYVVANYPNEVWKYENIAYYVK